MPRTVYVCRTVDKTVPPRSNNYSSISTTCSANYPQMEHLDCDVNDNNRTAVHTELQVHKIHWFGFGTWAVNMSSMTLDQLEHITFLHHHLSDNYQNISFFYRTVRGWNCLPDDAVHTLLPFPGVATIMSKSQCRNEEPETFVSVLISTTTTVMHLDSFCYALSTADTSTSTGQESKSSASWSLKVPTVSKKEQEVKLPLG